MTRPQVYEVLTSTGRCVEVTREVWEQFPDSDRRVMTTGWTASGLWPGRVIELYGCRYRVLYSGMKFVGLEQVLGE